MIAEFQESINVRIPRELKYQLEWLSRKCGEPVAGIARHLLMKSVGRILEEDDSWPSKS